MELALGVFVASLLGSVHCAGMCGPFVCLYAAGRGTGAAPHLAYNAGRFVAYLTLGAIAGAVGGGLDQIGALAGISRAAAIAAGSLMVAWGTATLLAARGVRLPLRRRNPVGPTILGSLLSRFRGQAPVVRGAATGLLTTLLPCGWLYAFVAAAAGTGSAPRGAMLMAFFWLGTLPVMVTAGVGAQRLLGPLRSRLPVITAVAVIAMGFASIAGRMTIPRPAANAATALSTTARPAHGQHDRPGR